LRACWRLAAAFAFMTLMLVAPTAWAGETKMDPNTEDVLTGKVRPRQIPDNWLGSPAKSAPGWRYDDPDNSGNSVRIYRGDPEDSDPSKRAPYVVVIKNGVALGRDGKPLPSYVPSE